MATPRDAPTGTGTDAGPAAAPDAEPDPVPHAGPAAVPDAEPDPVADGWDDEAAATYDTPGEGMFAPELLDATVSRLAQLADGGRALELAIGTGRVAVPLAERGVPVAGIDYSPAMVEVLRTKLGEDALPVAVGDMTSVRVPGRFALVYVVYNSISNLLTQDAQVACFRNAAAHLGPGGRFVVELWVPELRTLPPGKDATVFGTAPGYLGVDTYDTLAQQVVSHHVWFGDEHAQPAGHARIGRSRHRYVWPAELDLMGRLAGFELESRHAGWSGEPFTADSRSHVSVYRLTH